MKRLALLAATAATGLACVAPAGAHVSAPSKKCSSSFKHAVIGGEEKCLRHGQMCQVAHKSQYLKYGFKCVGGKLRVR